MKGDALSNITGIVQVVLVEVDMSQFVSSSEKVVISPCLIEIVYPVITLPPLSGAIQVITTLSGNQVVVGATGWAGT